MGYGVELIWSFDSCREEDKGTCSLLRLVTGGVYGNIHGHYPSASVTRAGLL